MEEMTVVKRISFDAAHFLPNYEGKCKNMHGHHWVVELGVKGPVDPETGMVIDFSILGGLLGTLKNKLDHTLLNDTIPNPTAENLCSYVKDFEAGVLEEEGFKLTFIKVWETEDSYAVLEV